MILRTMKNCKLLIWLIKNLFETNLKNIFKKIYDLFAACYP